MQLILSKKPKNPTLVLGFPGFGLVGSIAAEFLASHLKTEKIGKILITEMPAMVAIHQQKMVDTVSLYYNQENNLLIIHGTGFPRGVEWETASQIEKIASLVAAKEIISLEGVGSSGEKKPQTLFHSTQEKSRQKLVKIGISPLEEGVLIGITAAILSTTKIPVTCIFQETASEIPDSKAAAEIIKALDRYLGLDVDYKPLLIQAQRFEEKLKSLISSGQKAQEINDKKWMSYVG